MEFIKKPSWMEPNFGAEIIQHDDKLLIFSGYGSKSYLKDFLFEFDLKKETMKKKTVSSHPDVTAGKSVFYYEPKNEFIIFGGYQKIITKISASTFKATNLDAPLSVRYFSSVLDGDVIYIFGGLLEHQNQVKTKDVLFVFTYNISTNEWEEICTFGDIPKPTTHHKAVIDKNRRIFVESKGNLYLFNQHTSTWTLITQENYLKRSNTMVSVGKYIYFIGSSEENSNIFRYDTLLKVSEEIDSGAYKEKLKGGKHRIHSSCLVNHSNQSFIYTFGGWNDKGVFFDHMFKFDVSQETRFGDENKMFSWISEGKLIDLKFLFL